MAKTRPAGILLLLSAVGLLSLPSAVLAQTPPPLFKELPAGAALAKIAPGPFAARMSQAALEAKALRMSHASGEPAARLELNLFADVRLSAERTALHWKDASAFTWVGRVTTDPASQVILVSRRGALTGSIQAHGRIYEIMPTHAGTQAITELDVASLEEAERAHPKDWEGPTQEAFPLPLEKSSASADSLIEIDVMVVYEKAVADRVADMEAFITSLIDASNESYVRSKVPQRLRLVHFGQVNSGVSGTNNLSWLRSNADIAKLRDQHGADLVAMLLESLSACGVGYMNGAHTITRRACALGSRSFTHELGHNMGANHDRDQFENPSGFNYGYINRARNWRTIMSYATGCTCPRINNFSNPDVPYNGDPTGVANSQDNARMLRSKTLSVSNFRRRTAAGPRLTVVKVGAGAVVSDAPGIQCGEDCEQDFAQGTSTPMRLTAIPDSGWTFKGWEGDCQGTGACVLAVDGAKQAVARFVNENFLSLSIMDATRRVELKQVKDSAEFSLEALPPRIAVVAQAAGAVGSIQFTMEGPQEREHVESVAPYALFSDTVDGGLTAWSPAPVAGLYRITLTAFAGTGATGEELATKEFVLNLKPGTTSTHREAGASATAPDLRITTAGFQVNLKRSEHLEVFLLSPDGRRFPQARRRFEAGTTSLPWSRPSGSGVHVLVLRGPGSGEARKLVMFHRGPASGP
jgi:hypothetical protein